MFRITALTLMAAGFQCAPEMGVKQGLAGLYGEAVVDSASKGGWTLERWENAERKTYTVTATDRSGLTCVMASGTYKVV